MPGIKGLQGLDALEKKLKQVSEDLRGKVSEDALKAGAEVFAKAIREGSGAPRRSGKAQRSVIIYPAMRKALHQVRVLAGYSRDAFYMYFLEHGWRASVRKRIRRRYGTQPGHAQLGITTGYKWINPRKFFAVFFEGKYQEAYDAVIASLNKYLEKVAR